MAQNIIMPQGGQDITEGRVVRWLKAEGEAVAKGEVLCEVETEKAVFEVQSPMDGILVKILVPAGKVAEVFSTIGVVAAPGEAVDLSGSAPQGEGPSGAEAVQGPQEKGPVPEAPREGRRVPVSGRARKRADEAGVDISRVTGTGPNGRITEKDVLAYLAATPPAPSAAAPPPVAPKAPEPAPAQVPKGLPGTSVPFSKMRKVIARRLQQSKQTIPHFYVTVRADVTEAVLVREEVNGKADKENRISMNDLLVKAVAVALGEFPQVNCRVEEDALVILQDINIGIAVSLDQGLVVPVLPAADHLSLKGIASKTKELIALAKAGKQPNLVSGSFTISNMGMLDVENFIAIINPPETAILAVGSARKEVRVFEDNSLRIREMMTMTLSADHRAVDGVLASRFLNRVRGLLEDPRTLVG